MNNLTKDEMIVFLNQFKNTAIDVHFKMKLLLVIGVNQDVKSKFEYLLPSISKAEATLIEAITVFNDFDCPDISPLHETFDTIASLETVLSIYKARIDKATTEAIQS